MNYGKKSPSMGTPSLYSHVTTRSSANLKSSRSMRSVKTCWYQKPILTNAYLLDIQRGAMLTALFSLVSMQFKNNRFYLIFYFCHLIFYFISVISYLYYLYINIRSLLSFSSYTRFNTLWLLYNIL